MFIDMPSSFPQEKFQGFGKHAAEFLPTLLSDEYFADPFKKRQHFDRAWMAVYYRYRTCSECNEEFKALLRNAPALWREWNADHEHTYKLERCVYTFFMNGLSVLESLGFCFYFVAGSIQPDAFPNMGSPKGITLKSTSSAFTAAFPQTSIAKALADLPQRAEYSRIDEIRNILAHRLSGMRSLKAYGAYQADGTYTHTSEDVWRIMGTDELPLGEELLQQHLDGITSLLTSLVEASIEFLRNSKPAKASA